MLAVTVIIIYLKGCGLYINPLFPSDRVSTRRKTPGKGEGGCRGNQPTQSIKVDIKLSTPCKLASWQGMCTCHKGRQPYQERVLMWATFAHSYRDVTIKRAIPAASSGIVSVLPLRVVPRCTLSDWQGQRGGRPTGTHPQPRHRAPGAGRPSYQRWSRTWSAPWWFLPFENSDKLSVTTIKFQLLVLAYTRAYIFRTVSIWWPEGGGGEEPLRVNLVHILRLRKRLSLDSFPTFCCPRPHCA